MKPHTDHSSMLAYNPHTFSCRLETTPRPPTIPTTGLALSKWVLLSCSGMGDNIFNSWIGKYRFGVLACTQPPTLPYSNSASVRRRLPFSIRVISEGGSFPFHFTSLYNIRSPVTQSHASLHALSRSHLPQGMLLYFTLLFPLS